ncbi:hypothetical protein LX36DRAFT_284162 [Colletotrichum falcatum]|nr:hypothetical protein LX36DRAFT_284162 [Colletotrichum falcatum]
MDPDVCRNCGHSGKHIDFRDFRCAITERDDAERDKIQADAALERARQLCESSLALMKRQIQELEDANATIVTLSRAAAAADEEMGDAGRESEEAREADDQQWERSNERFCKWLRRSESQRQIMKSSWTKMRVVERLANEAVGAGVHDDDNDNDNDDNDDDDELAKRNRVQEWAAARRLTDQLPPEDDPTMETEYLNSEPEPQLELTDLTEPTEEEVSAEFAVPPAPAPRAPTKPPTLLTMLPSPAKKTSTRRAAALRTRAKASREAAVAAAATAQTAQTVPPSPAKGRALRTARRVESQTRSEPTRPTTTTTTMTTTTTTNTNTRVRKKEPRTATTTATQAVAPAAPSAKAGTAAGSDGAGRPAARTRARTGKDPAPETSVTAAAGRPQRATRRRSLRSQPYPQPGAQPRWK